MLWNHQLGAKYGPRGPPRAIYEPYMSRDTYCIERVKISNCGFGLKLNAPHNNVNIVTTGAIAFAGKICKCLSIFLQTAFH